MAVSNQIFAQKPDGAKNYHSIQIDQNWHYNQDWPSIGINTVVKIALFECAII